MFDLGQSPFSSSKYSQNCAENSFFRPQRTVQQESTSTYLLQSSIFCSQERCYLPACDRFDFIYPFCSRRSFSDGGAPLFKKPSQERGLHDKYRSKTPIFPFQFTNPLKGLFVSYGAQNTTIFSNNTCKF